MSNFGEIDRIATSGLVMSGEVAGVEPALQHIGKEGRRRKHWPEKKGTENIGQRKRKKKRLARPEKKQKKTLARKVNIMIPSSMSTATLCSQLSP